MVFDRLRRRVALAFFAVFALLAGAAIAAAEGLAVAAGLLLAAAVALAVLLWRALDRRLATAAGMIEALRHGDLQIRAGPGGRDGEGAPLEDALRAAARNWAAARRRLARELHLNQAIVRHAPVPLFMAEDGRAFRPLNGPGRRLLALMAPDAAALPAELGRRLAGLAPGAQETVSLAIAGRDERFEASLALVEAEGRRVRLLALLPVGSSLEAAEIAAWQKLFQVLSHEIMNSLTPILSLTRTAAGRLAAVGPAAADADAAALADAREALETVLRRAEGLKRFVAAYRQLARPPELRPRTVAIAALFRRIARLVQAELAARGIRLETEVRPRNLELRADPELLEQALLNLVWNARDALDGRPDGRIRLAAGLDRAGRVEITVADNGPGVPEELGERIFLPFFTTKPGGEGIGLALVRRIVVAHRGRIACRRAEGGGAVFTLGF
ncbi:MAG: hypothetical protein KatS3mg119_2353 [Rhodothalassiaceae bacterium]|nr:MAG: hypothetical protein KatS3mg119_2353 [Rhodothalassiaceae bacterium]